MQKLVKPINGVTLQQRSLLLVAVFLVLFAVILIVSSNFVSAREMRDIQLTAFNFTANVSATVQGLGVNGSLFCFGEDTTGQINCHNSSGNWSFEFAGSSVHRGLDMNETAWFVLRMDTPSGGNAQVHLFNQTKLVYRTFGLAGNYPNGVGQNGTHFLVTMTQGNDGLFITDFNGAEVGASVAGCGNCRGTAWDDLRKQWMVMISIDGVIAWYDTNLVDTGNRLTVNRDSSAVSVRLHDIDFENRSGTYNYYGVEGILADNGQLWEWVQVFEPPAITNETAFLNSSVGHNFTVWANVSDINGVGDIVATNLTSTAGSCLNIQNMSENDIFGSLWNCSGAGETEITIGFTDAQGNYNSTIPATNVYPNNAPIVPPTVFPSVLTNISSDNQDFTCSGSADLDNDTLYYEFYVGQTNPPVTLGQNTTSTSYSHTFSSTGNWYFRCRAHDAYEASGYTSTVELYVDFEVPVFSNVQNNGSSARITSNVSFGANISDDLGLSFARVADNLTGQFVNGSLKALSGIVGFINKSVIVNVSGGTNVCFMVWANDSLDNSNTAVSCFTPLNTAPVINKTPDVAQSHSVNLSVQINASDADGNTLTYYDNSSLFNINPSSGLIDDNATQADVGNYSINVSVDDGSVNASFVFWYNITNDAPTIPSTLLPGSSNITSSSQQITCSGSTDADGDSVTYELYGDTSTTPTTLLQNTTSTTYVWNFAFGESYYFRCRAHDGLYASGYTSTNYLYVDFVAAAFSNVQNNASSARMHDNASFGAGISDDRGLSFVRVSDNLTGSFVNGSLKALNGVAGLINTSLKVNLSKNTNVCFMVWANDTLGNSNTTISCFTTVNTVPSAPPTFSPSSLTNYTSVSVGLSCSGSGDVDNDSLTYEFYGDQSNPPSTLRQNTSATSYTLSFDSTGNWYFRCRSHDGEGTSSYVSTTELYVDFLTPIFANVQSNATGGTLRTGQNVSFGANISDDLSLSYVRFAENSSGSFVNGSLVSASGTATVFNTSFVNNAAKGVNVCGMFWSNDTLNNPNTTTTCLTVVNTPPAVGHAQQFVNYTDSHQFNVSIAFADGDNFTDIKVRNVSASSCTYLTNSSSGNIINLTYNCSGAALTSLAVQVNVSDADGDGVASSVASNVYPNKLPTLSVSPALNVTGPGTDDVINCDAGTYSDAEGDAQMVSQWKWFDTGEEISGQDIQTLNLNLSGLDKDDQLVCSERPYDGIEYGGWHNSSNTATIGNTQPTITKSGIENDTTSNYPSLAYDVLTNGTFSDRDSDSESGRAVRWKNGSTIIPGEAGYSLNCSLYNETYCTPGQSIAVEQRVNDGSGTANAWSEWNTSNTIIIDALDAAPRSYPNTTTAGVNDSDGDGNAELSWTDDAVESEETYRIYRHTVQINSSNVADAMLVRSGISEGVQFFEDNSTSNNTVYWYAVVTNDKGGNYNTSVFDASRNASINDTVKSKIPSSVGVTGSGATAAVTWLNVTQDVNGNSDFYGLQYVIYYGTDFNSSKSFANDSLGGASTKTVSANSTTISVTRSGTYHFIITTLDDGGNENLSLFLSENYGNASLTYTAPSSGSGSSGGSGGGSGGGGPVTGVQSKSSSRYYDVIPAGERTMMGISSPEIAFTEASFDTKQQLNKATITITSVDTGAVPVPITAVVYQYLNIELANVQDGDVSSVKIEFKVSKAWISDNGYDKSSVVLNRLVNREWVKLPTSLPAEETADDFYYTAASPGFSFFAITASPKKADVLIQSKEMDNETSANQTSGTVQERREEVKPQTFAKDRDFSFEYAWPYFLFAFVVVASAYYLEKIHAPSRAGHVINQERKWLFKKVHAVMGNGSNHKRRRSELHKHLHLHLPHLPSLLHHKPGKQVRKFSVHTKRQRILSVLTHQRRVAADVSSEKSAANIFVSDLKRKFKNWPKSKQGRVEVEREAARQLCKREGDFCVSSLMKQLEGVYEGEIKSTGRRDIYQEVRDWVEADELCVKTRKKGEVQYYKFL